jgi:type-F conjugative transfer system secretin TraK
MFRLLIITSLLISLPGYAFDIKPVKDNASVDITISNNSLNRVFVTTDRIIETYGIEGSYRIEKDEEQGSIYLIPAAYYKTKTFNLFIKTEHGHHYTLNVKPADIKAATIALKPLSPAKEQAKKWEIGSPYENVIIALIKDMSIGKSPDGYAVIPLGNTQKTEVKSNLALTLKTLYRGDYLEGQIWIVKNIGKSNISLSYSNFHDQRVRGFYLDKILLKSNEEATLYWVKNHAN